VKLLPDAEQSRPLAIGLLVVALIVVYLAGFHWFVVRQVALGKEISGLEQQIARFKATVARREPVEQRLAELRREQLGSALFLAGDDPNIAAAELIRALRDWTEQHATDTELCSIVSSQPRRATEPERFQQVNVSVRMQCPLDDFLRVLYEMENSVPLVFVDNLLVSQRYTASQRSRVRGNAYGQLDVRFEMIGYINQPGISP
jgi:general secretion pathway protein M